MQNQTYFIAFHLANSAYHRWNDSSSLEIQPRYLLSSTLITELDFWIGKSMQLIGKCFYGEGKSVNLILSVIV